MAGKNQMRETLIRERDALLRQREALDNQIMGLERAISLVSGEEQMSSLKPGGRRINLKGIMLKLLEEAGTTGMNAATAVEMASRKGITIERNSASSLLSRFKNDGAVVYDGDRYRLKDFAKPDSPRPIPMFGRSNFDPIGDLARSKEVA